MEQVTVRESELPGTESIQMEAGGPLAVGRGVGEMGQNCLRALECYD